MSASDSQLLQSYVRNGNQKAFEQLVKNYVQIAYSAALADLQSPDLAKDATQLTFMELSQKASKLSPEVKLGGWIFVAARNISRRIRRGEIRRAQRERHYLDDMKPTAEPNWGEIRPEIHAALAEIKPIYRDAIIMRFFQGKDFNELGQALHISTDAARMRLNRGLEKMNACLAKRGIRSSAAALGVALPAHAMASVPPGLTLSITKSISVSAGATAATSSILTTSLTIMKTNTILTIGALATTALTCSVILLREPSPPNEKPQTSSQPIGDREQIPRTKRETVSNLGPGPTASTRKSGGAQGADLGIDAHYLEKANIAVANLEEMLKVLRNPQIAKIAFNVSLPNPIKQLELRMGLDENTARAVEAIIAEHNRVEGERVGNLRKKHMEFADNIVTNHREDMVNMIALSQMEEDPESFTNDLKEYMLELKSNFLDEAELLTEDPGSKEPQEWFENDAAVAQIEAVLDAQKQPDFQEYIREQKTRKVEAAIVERTDDLTNTLGLNDTERADLHQFLTEHPDASKEEISEILSPELRPLLMKSEGDVFELIFDNPAQ